MKKWLYLMVYVMVWAALLSGILPDFIAFDKSRTIGWLVPFLIIIGLPYILNLTLKGFQIKYGLRLIIVFSSVFLGFPYGLVVGEANENELMRDGRVTKGIVYKKWRSRGEWLLKARYQVNGMQHETFTVTDDQNRFSKNDSVTIIYSVQNPDLSKIKELN